MVAPKLLVNPRAAGLASRAARASFARDGREAGLSVRETEGTADLTASVREAVSSGAQRVVVAGGDGTLHHAIQALAGTRTALGIVPAGRGNDLARALALPRDRRRALALAAAGPLRRIDLGRTGERWFACVGGVGLDGAVAEAARHGLRGPLAYPWALLRTLPGFVPPDVRVEHEDGVWEGRAMLVLLANGSTFGGGMRVAPEARLDDGLLDLVVVRAIGKLELLRVFPRVYAGTHLRHRAVSTARVAGARVLCHPPLLPWGDGEPLASAAAGEIHFAAAPGALLVAAGGGG